MRIKQNNEAFLRSFLQSSNSFALEKVQERSLNLEYYKFAYAKMDDGSILKMGLKSQRILQITHGFSTNQHLSEMLEKGNIIKTELVLNQDETSALVLDQSFRDYQMDEFERYHFLKQTQAHRDTFIDNHDALEVISPVILDGEIVGSLFLFFDLNGTNKMVQFVQFILIMISILLALIGSIWVGVIYFKNKNITNLEQADQELGVYNRSYFFNILDIHLEKGTIQKSQLVIFQVENLARLRLVHSYTNVQYSLINLRQIIHGIWSQEIFRYFDDTFILYIDEIIDETSLVEKVQATKDLLVAETPFKVSLNVHAALLPLSVAHKTRQSIVQNLEIAIMELKQSVDQSVMVVKENLWDEVLYLETLENDLRSLSKTGFDQELFLAFQPQIDIEKGEVYGFECLARWNHAVYGMVSPEIFCMLAERSNLVFDLSDWIIRQSARFVKKLQDLGYHDLVVSTNLSVMQLKTPHFDTHFERILRSEMVKPSDVGIEITETILIDNAKELNQKIKKLRDMGVNVSLDDFGTGYASLASLQLLEVDTLKIDKTFIASMFDDKIFLESIISIAHQLDLSIIAEGVESKEQLENLRKLGVHLIQGFYFSKAMRETDAIQFLTEKNGRLLC